MQKSVKLADDARKAYLAEEGGGPTNGVFVALSLGPFGSAVKPPQDFDGFYPPPFGPEGPHSDSKGAEGPGNTRLFFSDAGVVVEEKKAIEALAGFHLWRLRAVASNPETWNCIDYVVFETIPHLRELRAIKVAMARFDAGARGTRGGGELKWLKGLWLSLVFPDGEGLIQWDPEEREHQTRILDDRIGAVPAGFGLNCTRIYRYPSVLSSIISGSNSKSPSEEGRNSPVPLMLVATERTKALLAWWNRRVFPVSSNPSGESIPGDQVLRDLPAEQRARAQADM